ncbi:MAG: hypothetical protein VX519_01440 [Myxococcota bacterium]|nr:hypothetical protein [Myxococcota bacterium]
MPVLLAMVLASVLCSPTALAQDDEFRRPYEIEDYPTGLAMGPLKMFGATGIALVWRDDAKDSLNAVIAGKVSPKTLHVHLDYQLNLVSLDDPNAPDIAFPLYIGAGLRLRLNEEEARGTARDPFLGLRVPLGIAILPPSWPIDGFLEFAPVIGLHKQKTATEEVRYNSADFAFGARYYFR